MKRALLCIAVAFVMVGTVAAQDTITTIGMIGTALPNGWNDPDTNMVQDPDSAHLWTLNITLMDGVVKFRANDNWDLAWGSTDSPVGIGDPTGGSPDIPVVAGTYNVMFNSNTGFYYFEAVSPVGIIGEATYFGWNRDMNMHPDPDDVNSFFLELDLTMGPAKFRLDDDWAVNWGSTDFPSGVGVQDGPDIPVARSGRYLVTLDTSTGAYNFGLLSFDAVFVYGSATPGGDTPTEMTPDANDPNGWSIGANMSDGELRFMGVSSGDTIRWGAADFPSGTAAVDGPGIPVPAGKYLLEFDSRSLDYTFTEVQIYQTMGIIGDATPNGWADPDTDMERSPVDSSEWMLRIVLTDGFAKFRANDNWDVNWGADAGADPFPTGTAVLFGADIPITAGEYQISFNSFTGAYNFNELMVFDTIGLIGTGTPFGDWDNDVLMDKDPNDENRWTITEVALSDGDVKFRVNQAWDINWGATDWPTGVGTQDGPDIPCVAGTYGVVLNSITGEYAFGDPLSGTEDVLDPSVVKAYPNPAAEVLNVDISEVPMTGEVRLHVYNMAGTLCLTHTQNAEQVMQVDITSLNHGPYMLQIVGDGYIIGKKFVVAR